jgi:UDP-glucose 4-epimerase
VVTSKSVLVTGGAGFIGSHLVEKLVQLDYRVLVVDDLSTGKLRNLPRGVSFYHTDINESTIEEIFAREKPSFVFHHAAQISVSNSVRDPMKDCRINITGTIKLIEAARRYGVDKLIFASTGGALYGDPNVTPCSEDHPVIPLSPYGLSKYACEMYLDLYRRLYRLGFVALRYGNVYGPRQDPRGEAGVVAIFSKAMAEGKPTQIFGDGRQQRDFVYVEDVVNANLRAMKEGIVGSFNIGTSIGSSINDIFKILSKQFNYKRTPVYAPARPGDVWKISLDYSKAKKEMDWEPQVDLLRGLELTAKSFMENSTYPTG